MRECYDHVIAVPVMRASGKKAACMNASEEFQKSVCWKNSTQAYDRSWSFSVR